MGDTYEHDENEAGDDVGVPEDALEAFEAIRYAQVARGMTPEVEGSDG